MHVSPPAGLPRPYSPPPPGMSGNTVFTLTMLIGVIAAALGSLLYLTFAPPPTSSAAPSSLPSPTQGLAGPAAADTRETVPAEPQAPETETELEPDPTDFSPTLSSAEEDSTSLDPLTPQDIKLPPQVGEYKYAHSGRLGYYAHATDYSVITLASYTEENAQFKRDIARDSGDPFQEYNDRFFCYSYTSGAAACIFEFPANSGHYLESYSSLRTLEELHTFSDELLKQATR